MVETGEVMRHQQKIEKLTDEQESQFLQYRENWTSRGLSVEPADRPQAEAAIKACYRHANIPEPKKIVWCGSPFSQSLARAIVIDPAFVDAITDSVWDNIKNGAGSDARDEIKEAFGNSVRLIDCAGVKSDLKDRVIKAVETRMTADHTARIHEQIRESVTETVWKNVWQVVWSSVREEVWTGVERCVRNYVTNKSGEKTARVVGDVINGTVGRIVRKKVWDQTRDHAWIAVGERISAQSRVRAWDQLWGPVHAAVWSNIALHVAAHIRASSNGSVESNGYGQHDANWLGFYEYLRDVVGLTRETEKLDGLLGVGRHAGWFAPHEHICWVSERPCLLLRDAQGRLHSQKGPALSYPDGWSVYAKNGNPIYAINGVRADNESS